MKISRINRGGNAAAASMVNERLPNSPAATVGVFRKRNSNWRNAILSQACSGISADEFTCLLRPADDITHMTNLIRKFIKDESGATAIEYGLIAAGISLVIIAAVNGIGSKLNTKFTAINTSLK